MAATVGIIAIGLRISTRGLQQGLGNASKSIQNFTKNAVTSFAGIGLAIDGVKKSIDLLSAPIRLAAELEQTSTAFEVLLGSAESAETMLKQLKDFAASTPFQFTELADSAKKLTAFGFSAEEVVPNLKRLGDLASGIGIPFSELSEIYGKARVQGRLFGEDINQLLGRGIPVVAEFAKQFGVTESEVKKLVSEGKVNFKHLEKAIVSLTSSGGQFAGMMEKSSQTTLGLWSTLKDNVREVAITLGDELIKAFDLKWVMDNAIGQIKSSMPQIKDYIVRFVQGAKSAFDQLVKTIIALKPVFSAVLSGVKAIVGGIASLITGFQSLGGSVGTAIAALGILATTNPFLALIAGITAIIGKLEQLKKGLGSDLVKGFVGIAAGVVAFNKLAGALNLVTGSAIKSTMALKGALVAAVAFFSYKITSHIAESFNWQGMKDYNEQLERGVNLQSQLMKRQGKQQAAVLKQSVEIEDPTKRKDFLAKELANAQKSLQGMANTVRGAKDEVKKYDTTWKNLVGHKELERTRNELANATVMYDQQKDHVEALREALGDTTKEIEKQAEQRRKAIEEEKQAKVEAFEAENIKKATDLVTKLRDEVKYFGQTTQQVEIKKLEGLVDPKTIEELKALNKQLTILEERKKVQEEIAEAGKKPLEEFTKRIAQYRFELNAGKVGQEQYAAAVKELAGSMLGVQVETTPLEKYNEKVKALNAAFAVGVFSKNPAEYFRQIKEAQDQLKTDKFDQLPDRLKKAFEKTKTPVEQFTEELKKMQKGRAELFAQYQQEFGKEEGIKRAKAAWSQAVDDLQKEIEDKVGKATDKTNKVNFAPTWKTDPEAMILAITRRNIKPKLEPDLGKLAEQAKGGVIPAAKKIGPVAKPIGRMGPALKGKAPEIKPPDIKPLEVVLDELAKAIQRMVDLLLKPLEPKKIEAPRIEAPLLEFPEGPKIEGPDATGITAQLDQSLAEIEAGLMGDLSKLPPPELSFDKPMIAEMPQIRTPPIEQIQPKGPSRLDAVEAESRRLDFGKDNKIFGQLEKINQEQLVQLQSINENMTLLASKMDQPRELDF